MSPSRAQEDLAEALEALGRLRLAVGLLAAEADGRRRLAACHAADPLHPRAQGLQAAAAFHAARLDEGRLRLAAAEGQVAALRRAAARAQPGVPAPIEARVRRCG